MSGGKMVFGGIIKPTRSMKIKKFLAQMFQKRSIKLSLIISIRLKAFYFDLGSQSKAHTSHIISEIFDRTRSK